MSRSRHLFLFDACGRRLAQAATGAWTFPHGHVIRAHAHPEDQLLFAVEGVMTVETNHGLWVVPPLRAVWIPAETTHRVRVSGRVSMRTIYFLPRLCSSLPRRCLVVNVSSLLKELILYACTFQRLRRRVPAERHLLDLLIDQFKAIESVPVQLPHPSDPRARRLAELLSADPADRRALRTLSRSCGAGTRTMQRLFAEQTGMSFSTWRQRLRLIYALQSLAAGESVTTVALQAGYSAPSAFIAMFRRQLGTTPAHYLAP